MATFKAVLSLLGAAFLTAALIFAWDMLGDYYMVLEIMPDVPLIGARLAFGIVIVYLAWMGVSGLKQARDNSPQQQQ